MHVTPFIVGNPVPPEHFINRRREVRRAVSLLLSGQSLAFTGEPRIGKTSLLDYLKAPETRRELYGEAGERMVFRYFDAQSWPDGFSRIAFWKQALEPLVEAIRRQAPTSPLLELHRECSKEEYGTYVLERLFANLQESGWHLVLLLDEFDAVLQHPQLNSTEFYGGLRTLASRCGQALTLILASRRPLSDLNAETQHYARTGSPFFNFVQEFPLKPFSQKHRKEILKRAGRRFKPRERDHIFRLAGGHPYLLQVAAAALWDAYEDGLAPDARLRYVSEELRRVAADTLQDTWRNWTPAMRKAFAIIALDEAPSLLNEREFDLGPLLKALQSHPRELRQLKEKGFIVESQRPDWRMRSGYEVAAKVMLLWLAEELISELRHEEDLRQLLEREEWIGQFKRGERDAFVRAVQGLGRFAREGVQSFVKAAAEGLGKGITS